MKLDVLGGLDKTVDVEVTGEVDEEETQQQQQQTKGLGVATECLASQCLCD